ncbi:MAG: acyl carrier protein [Candidatus Binatia bacterium]
MHKTNKDTQKIMAQQNIVESIQAWMVVRLSEELKIAPAEIDLRKPLLTYGLDSVVAFTLTGELAEWLGHDLPGTLLWDYPTLETLASYLADEIKGDGKSAELLFGELNHAIAQVEELPDDQPLESARKRNRSK